MNNLIDSLRSGDRALLLANAQTVQAMNGQVLFEPGDDIKHTYFPCGPTLISFLVQLPDGRTAETALIGREGAVGGIVSEGFVPAYCRAVVQYPGSIMRLSLEHLNQIKLSSSRCHQLFARYADCLLAQIFQSVACNALHSIEQRAARSILSILDHTDADSVRMTQEQLASMMGVGRSYMARVIAHMRTLGILDTTRGGLHVKSRDLLERLACDCEAQVKEHFRAVLKGVYPGKA